MHSRFRSHHSSFDRFLESLTLAPDTGSHFSSHPHLDVGYAPQHGPSMTANTRMIRSRIGPIIKVITFEQVYITDTRDEAKIRWTENESPFHDILLYISGWLIKFAPRSCFPSIQSRSDRRIYSRSLIYNSNPFQHQISKYHHIIIYRQNKWLESLLIFGQASPFCAITMASEERLSDRTWAYTPSSRALLSRLKEFKAKGDYEAATRALRFYYAHEETQNVNVYCCNLVLSSFVVSKLSGPACAFLHEMIFTYSLKPDAVSYSIVISTFTPDLWFRALELFDLMKHRNVQLDVVVYNTMMNLLAKARRFRTVLQLLREMEVSYALQPDVVSYAIAVQACERTSNWYVALKLLKEMERKKVTPNLVCYNSAIAACASAYKPKQAIRLFFVMRRRHISPDLFTFSSLMTALVKGKMNIPALALFSHLQRNFNIKPDIVCYGAAMAACAQQRDARRAMEILRDMEMHNLSPNPFILSSCMMALHAASMPSMAYQLFRKWKQDSRNKPDVVVYTVAILAQRHKGHWKEAVRLLIEMNKTGIIPNVASYTAAVSVCSRSGRWDKALQLIRLMQFQNMQPNLYTFNSMLFSCVRQKKWELALEIMEEMSTMDMEPDRLSYCASIQTCIAANQCEIAVTLFKEAIKRELDIPEQLYYSLISLVSENKHIQLRDEMVSLLSNFHASSVERDREKPLELNYPADPSSMKTSE